MAGENPIKALYEGLVEISRTDLAGESVRRLRLTQLFPFHRCTVGYRIWSPLLGLVFDLSSVCKVLGEER